MSSIIIKDPTQSNREKAKVTFVLEIWLRPMAWTMKYFVDGEHNTKTEDET